jgi:hypothetical protein
MFGISGLAVRNALDERTEGALYALQYEASENGWDPHVWAQKFKDGTTRFIFYATDSKGHTRYFDYATAQDTGNLAEKVIFFERMLETRKAEARVREGLTRLDAGLDPVRHRINTEKLD